MRKFLVSLIFLSCAFSQASFTPGQPATAAKPAQLIISAGTNVSCTITGDTFPAKNLNVTNCNAGGVSIPNFSIPNTVSLPWALTIQVNSGSNAATFILQITSTSPNFVIQATVNGTTPVTGTF